MAVAIIGPKFYAFHPTTGQALAFGKVWTYQAGTNTPKATFTAEGGEVENSNPVILNGAGYANIYLDGSYKIVVTDENDVEIWTSDPVTDAGGLANEWVKPMTATQTSATTFTVPGNYTSYYTANRRIKAKDLSFLYGRVVSSSYGAGLTTVTVQMENSAPLTNNLVRVWVSIIQNYAKELAGSVSTSSIQYLAKDGTTRTLAEKVNTYIDADADFGCVFDGATSVRAKLQAAVNWIANNDGGTLILPRGVGVLDGTVYLHYDEVNNPTGNPSQFHQGKFNIVGQGACNWNNLSNEEFVGTTFKYTLSGGAAFSLDSGVVSPEVPYNGSAYRLSGFSIKAATSGNVIQMKSFNVLSELENITILNESTGTCVYISAAWVSNLKDVYVHGEDGAYTGTGFKYEPIIHTVTPVSSDSTSEAAGGCVQYINCSAVDFNVGWDMGRAYSASYFSHTRSITTIGMQAAFCKIGMRLRWGVGNMLNLSPYFEANIDPSDEPNSRDIVISDGAGFMNYGTDLPSAPVSNWRLGSLMYGTIQFINGVIQSSSDQAGHCNVQLGSDTGTTSSDTIANVVFDCVSWPAVKRRAIRRYNTYMNGDLILRNCAYYEFDNGSTYPRFVELEDEDQYGRTIIADALRSNSLESKWVADASDNDVHYRAEFDMVGSRSSESFGRHFIKESSDTGATEIELDLSTSIDKDIVILQQQTVPVGQSLVAGRTYVVISAGTQGAAITGDGAGASTKGTKWVSGAGFAITDALIARYYDIKSIKIPNVWKRRNSLLAISILPGDWTAVHESATAQRITFTFGHLVAGQKFLDTATPSTGYAPMKLGSGNDRTCETYGTLELLFDPNLQAWLQIGASHNA